MVITSGEHHADGDVISLRYCPARSAVKKKKGLKLKGTELRMDGRERTRSLSDHSVG